MKKILLIILTVTINTCLFSCTSDDLEDSKALQDSFSEVVGDDDGQTPTDEPDILP